MKHSEKKRSTLRLTETEVFEAVRIYVLENHDIDIPDDAEVHLHYESGGVSFVWNSDEG